MAPSTRIPRADPISTGQRSGACSPAAARSSFKVALAEHGRALKRVFALSAFLAVAGCASPTRVASLEDQVEMLRWSSLKSLEMSYEMNAFSIFLLEREKYRVAHRGEELRWDVPLPPMSPWRVPLHEGASMAYLARTLSIMDGVSDFDFSTPRSTDKARPDAVATPKDVPTKQLSEADKKQIENIQRLIDERHRVNRELKSIYDGMRGGFPGVQPPISPWAEERLLRNHSPRS